MDSVIRFFSNYLFLLSGLYFLLWWMVFFISFGSNWEVRKKILVVSGLFAIATPFVETLTLRDWWSPVFIWNAFPHAEDLLFGFAIAGTTAGMYFWVSKNIRVPIERQAVFSPLLRGRYCSGQQCFLSRFFTSCT